MLLGIDVGLDGAVAVLDDDGKLVTVFDLPTMASGKKGATVKRQINAVELHSLLTNGVVHSPWAGVSINDVAYVESVTAMPKQGVSSMFSLGQSYGTVLAVLACLRIPTHIVTPATWKKYFGLARDKEASRSLAIRLYPAAALAHKKDHNKAEAILIALWGWHQ